MKTFGINGGASLALGVIVLVTGLVTGVLCIINGAVILAKNR